ncbi:uncharacterized protein LOC129307696 [Prosopis cineraria]|uniref:uncharacterized protein LOC129307696 n=1 Tax=Prosopis cineraria TaxID=364024 RepID=UPI0024102EC0|nr:uncharacterized protein LOC129307696 [Prosopis cineraria]
MSFHQYSASGISRSSNSLKQTVASRTETPTFSSDDHQFLSWSSILPAKPRRCCLRIVGALSGSGKSPPSHAQAISVRTSPERYRSSVTSQTSPAPLLTRLEVQSPSEDQRFRFHQSFPPATPLRSAARFLHLRPAILPDWTLSRRLRRHCHRPTDRAWRGKQGK